MLIEPTKISAQNIIIFLLALFLSVLFHSNVGSVSAIEEKSGVTTSTIHTYAHQVKRGESSWLLSREYCALDHIPKNLKRGQVVGIRVDRQIVFNTITAFSSNYGLPETELSYIINSIFDLSMEYRLPPCLIFAIIDVESLFRQTSISRRGALGLMQVMPFHAPALGIKARDLYQDVTINMQSGVRILKSKSDYYDREDWFVAYNTGSKFTLKQSFKGNPVDVAHRYRTLVLESLSNIYKVYQVRSISEIENDKGIRND